MGRRRFTRSRVRRGALLAGAMALSGGWFVACILDPPPTLPPVGATAPYVQAEYPPMGDFTNWPTGALTFTVQVEVLNAAEGVRWVLLQDEGTSASLLVRGPIKVGPAEAGLIDISVPVSGPPDTNCHSYTLYVDAVEDAFFFPPSSPPVVSCSPNLCSRVQWTYHPPGSVRCPVFDAGASTAHDAASEAPLSTGG